MTWIGMALWAEGPTDQAFLRPLLRRLVEDLLQDRGDRQVDVPDVLDLNDHLDRSSLPDGRAERVREAARQARGHWTLLLVHADGGGDPERARREQIDPALEACLRDVHAEEAGPNPAAAACAVVPVREMEAWALADRDVFDLPVVDHEPDAASGEPPRRARLVEKVEDPKALLDALIERRDGPFGRRGEQMKSIALEDLGRRVSLDRLRDVPGFRILEGELVESLQRLRLIPGAGA